MCGAHYVCNGTAYCAAILAAFRGADGSEFLVSGRHRWVGVGPKATGLLSGAALVPFVAVSVALALAAGVLPGRSSARHMVGTVRSSAVALCGAGDYMPPETFAQRTPGAVVGISWLGTWGASRCRLQTRLTAVVKPIKDRLIDEVTISLRGRTPCVLAHAPVSFAVQRETDAKWSTVKQVSGNPGHQTTGAVLAPGMPVNLLWVWINWCGDANEPFRALASIGRQVVAGRTSTSLPGSRLPPFCVTPSRPSTLAPSYGFLQ